MTLQHGLVVACYGKHSLVQDESNSRRVLCQGRGKKNIAVVGDRVQWQPTGDEGTIEAIEPRRNVLYRQDEARTKTFAANLDLVLIWLAAAPVFSEIQLGRALLACEAAGIAALVVLNKSDLGEAFDTAWQRLAAYRRMGYTVLPCAVKNPANGQMSALRDQIAGKTSLILGPSGAGKSSFVNAAALAADAPTAEISTALNSGKHTTTASTWYALKPWGESPQAGAIIDSPGFQEFGLHHIQALELAGLMPDIRKHLGRCRFANCTHLHEPDCGVRQAVAHASFDDKSAHRPDEISFERYAFYSSVHAEMTAAETATLRGGR